MGSFLALQADSGTSLPFESVEESIPSMKLTKLSPAPLLGRRCRLMRAKAHYCARTASQLIAGVRRTNGCGGPFGGGLRNQGVMPT
jgi:hypothetical protein